MAKLWGGRFKKEGMHPDVMKFTSSLGVDQVLAKYDCISTRVHVEMLEKCGYLSSDEKKALTRVLDDLLVRIKSGGMDFGEHEDIHSAVAAYVEERAPVPSGKMHTGRSRNEQVVNDVRLYCKDAVKTVSGLIEKLQENIVDAAEKFIDIFVPGYTHLNRAQPILFSHLLMAYVEMLGRDGGRLADALKRLDVSVMGSGAIAGSSLDLDRKFTASKLSFGGISANSVDSTADRDFMVELVAALSLVAVHLSRMSEDMILYSIPEFGFLEIDERFCTGSSLMPQKKNADVLELIRGRCAAVIGALNSLLVLLKGLPHAYNRDLQEDKKFLFESVETVSSALAMMSGIVSTMSLDGSRARGMLDDEFIYSTDIAEYLVRKCVPFSEAHRVVGNIVKHCVEKNINISDLSIQELKEFSDELGEDVYGLLNPATSVKMKRTPGSTNPDLVRKEIAGWRKRLS